MYIIKKIFQHLRYGGISKKTYKEILPLITQENNKSMYALSEITVFFGWALSLLSCFGFLSRKPLPAYLLLFVTSSAFIIIRRYIPQKNHIVSHFFCMMQGILLITFGLLTSTAFSPSPTANGVMFIVLIIVFPVIMISPPIEMDLTILIFSIIYCIFIKLFKDPITFHLDILNVIVTCLISFMCNYVFNAKNMQNLVSRSYIIKERDTDNLTELLTKQAGKTSTQSYLNNGINGALFVIDVDNFKKINDSYGHLYGDEILVKMSDAIKSNVKYTDVPARFGGDEFVIFYPGASEQEAEEKSKKLINSFKEVLADEKEEITCSIGVFVSEKIKDYETFFKNADDALYNSKNDGKNKYTIKSD